MKYFGIPNRAPATLPNGLTALNPKAIELNAKAFFLDDDVLVHQNRVSDYDPSISEGLIGPYIITHRMNTYM